MSIQSCADSPPHPATVPLLRHIGPRAASALATGYRTLAWARADTIEVRMPATA
jgi:hypothetical protein